MIFFTIQIKYLRLWNQSELRTWVNNCLIWNVKFFPQNHINFISQINFIKYNITLNIFIDEGSEATRQSNTIIVNNFKDHMNNFIEHELLAHFQHEMCGFDEENKWKSLYHSTSARNKSSMAIKTFILPIILWKYDNKQ